MPMELWLAMAAGYDVATEVMALVVVVLELKTAHEGFLLWALIFMMG